MTKTDFIIECAMRLYAADNGGAELSISGAEYLADKLEEKGYLKK